MLHFHKAIGCWYYCVNSKDIEVLSLLPGTYYLFIVVILSYRQDLAEPFLSFFLSKLGTHAPNSGAWFNWFKMSRKGFYAFWVYASSRMSPWGYGYKRNITKALIFKYVSILVHFSSSLNKWLAMTGIAKWSLFKRIIFMIKSQIQVQYKKLDKFW